MLPDLPLLLAFIGASLVLTLIPGPAVVYIVTRTLAHGRASGLSSVAGVAAGNLANALGTALGLAALFAASSAAFTVIKLAGAAYLVYLGVRMWMAAPASDRAIPGLRSQPLLRVFRDGFLVALLNPKTTLFFAAFFPQFIQSHHNALVQTIALGVVFVLVALLTDALYVLAANLLAPRLTGATRHRVWGNRIAGTSFIGLGVLTAMGTRPAR